MIAPEQLRGVSDSGCATERNVRSLNYEICISCISQRGHGDCEKSDEIIRGTSSQDDLNNLHSWGDIAPIASFKSTNPNRWSLRELDSLESI